MAAQIPNHRQVHINSNEAITINTNAPLTININNPPANSLPTNPTEWDLYHYQSNLSHSFPITNVLISPQFILRDERTYQQWAMIITNAITASGLEAHLYIDPLPHIITQPQPLQLQNLTLWISNDAKLQLFLLANCSSTTVLSRISGCKNARIMWRVLEQAYHPHLPMSSTREFFKGMKTRDFRSLEAFVEAFRMGRARSVEALQPAVVLPYFLEACADEWSEWVERHEGGVGRMDLDGAVESLYAERDRREGMAGWERGGL